MNIVDWIQKRVQDYPQWSRAERARLPEITAEVLDHAANGTGNRFVAEWCDRELGKWRDCGEGPWDSREDAETFAHAEMGIPYEIVNDNGQWRILAPVYR